MDKKRKRRWGDRRDGRRLRTLDPYNSMSPFIMKYKSDASNYFSGLIDVAYIEKFLQEKRQQGYQGIGILHLFVAAYIRVISQYPGVNRFVSGQRIFARNDIEFIMTIKTQMKTSASETSIQVAFDASDTIFDVFNKINVEIDKVRREGENTNTDDVAKSFMKLPRLILKFAVFFFTKLDYFGMLPEALIKASPFHGSIVITDLGSIGLPAIYHHLYDFGNIPVFVALGSKQKVCETRQDGTVKLRKYVDYKIVVDERICDGFYFSQAFKMLKSVLRQPELLETPPIEVVEDVE
ncbi:MAG: hypothetical protein FWH57_00820 [Oscillospiraceae bacterium]|nr:hypothetical protein [Oscillospiraceae bacterium]